MEKHENINIKFTDQAAQRLKKLIKLKKNSKLNLRLYIIGGGCSGFQYKFMLDDEIKKDDLIIKNNKSILVIDSLSFQYLVGSIIDYVDNISGSKFVVFNPNAETTCSCGLSFSV